MDSPKKGLELDEAGDSVDDADFSSSSRSILRTFFTVFLKNRRKRLARCSKAEDSYCKCRE